MIEGLNIFLRAFEEFSGLKKDTFFASTCTVPDIKFPVIKRCYIRLNNPKDSDEEYIFNGTVNTSSSSIEECYKDLQKQAILKLLEEYKDEAV